jgi:ribosomal-protein-alanine acetyltransferase
MDVKIKPVAVSCLGRLYEIEKECFEQEAFSKQQLAYKLTDYSGISLAALVGDEIAGFVIAQVDFGKNGAFGHVLTVDVAPAYRRRGIAQKLLHAVESVLKKRGIKEFRLEVRVDNFAALSLYRKMGYEEIGILERYYGDVDGVYLKKFCNSCSKMAKLQRRVPIHR